MYIPWYDWRGRGDGLAERISESGEEDDVIGRRERRDLPF